MKIFAITIFNIKVNEYVFIIYVHSIYINSCSEKQMK